MTKNTVKFDYNLKNSYDLINQVKNLQITSKTHTIISLDIEQWYPSLNLTLVKEALFFYALKYKFDHHDLSQLNFIIKMMEFSKTRSFYSFRDKFYQYLGKFEDPLLTGQTQGGHESADLSDLVGSYLFEKIFKYQEDGDQVIFGKLFRDDSFIVFNKVMTDTEISTWKSDFDRKIDALTSNTVKFTIEIMRDELNFLDTTCYFDHEDKLQFKVYKKPLHQLKYLNFDSCHTNSTKSNIPGSVLKRLVNLSTALPEKFTLREQFLDHGVALRNAGLIKSSFMDQILSKSGYSFEPESRKKFDTRSTFFTLAYSTTKWFKRSVLSIINDNLRRYGLKGWNAYHVYRKPNLQFTHQVRSKFKIELRFT